MSYFPLWFKVSTFSNFPELPVGGYFDDLDLTFPDRDLLWASSSLSVAFSPLSLVTLLKEVFGNSQATPTNKTQFAGHWLFHGKPPMSHVDLANLL